MQLECSSQLRLKRCSFSWLLAKTELTIAPSLRPWQHLWQAQIANGITSVRPKFFKRFRSGCNNECTHPNKLSSGC